MKKSVSCGPHKDHADSNASWVFRRSTMVRCLLAAVVVLLAACGATSEGTPPTSELTSSTVPSTVPAIVPGTRATSPTVVTTVPASSTSVVTTAPSAPIPSDAPVVTSDDAVLAPPVDPAALVLAGADPCRVLTGTARLGGCGVVKRPDETLVWFASDEDSPDPPTIVVYRLEADALVPVLELPEAARADVAPAHVEVADLDGSSGAEMVVGFRNTGSGGFLQLEVIGAHGAVVGHLSLDQGRAEIGPGGLTVWEAQYGPDDANCCPRTFTRDRIAFDGERFRRVSDGVVATENVPASQF